MAERGANYDSNCQYNRQRDCQHGDGRDRVCSRLGLRVNRRLNMRRMKAAVVSGARGVVDACAWNSDRAGYPAAAKRQMGTAHANGYARSRLGEIERQTREEVDTAIEAKISQLGPQLIRLRITRRGHRVRIDHEIRREVAA